MDVRKILLLVGALLIAGITAFAARSLVFGSAAPTAQAAAPVETGPKVMVALKDLPAGTILDPTAVTFQPWPKDLLDKAYFLDGTDPASLAGKVVRLSIATGQPLTTSSVVGPGERGFLAAALAPGMRAVTVSINDTSGVAGFVFPGDRVDLVLTHEVPALDDGLPLKVSETILRNVRVLAIDQRLTDPEGGQASVGRTITFEVTPKFVEKIAVAQQLGGLSLSLRSIADNAAELERAIASGEVEVPEGADTASDRTMMLALASKPSDANTTFTTGGEASRFARSTMPKPKPQPGADGGAPASLAAPRPVGPVVRIARGNDVTEVPLGAQ